MKTITIILHLSKEQTVTKHNVTPAEVAFYAAEHHGSYGNNPIDLVADSEQEVERKASQEIQRLYAKYPAKKIKVLYPAVMSNVPETFEEGIALGMGTELPTNSLVEHELGKE